MLAGESALFLLLSSFGGVKLRDKLTLAKLNELVASYTPIVSFDLWRSARIKYRPSCRKA